MEENNSTPQTQPTGEQKKTSSSTKKIMPLIILGVAFFALTAFAYLAGSRSNKNGEVATQKSETAPPSVSQDTKITEAEYAAENLTPTVKVATPTINDMETEAAIPSGWSTYKSIEYGFEISYPENYKALDDSNNLYGWPKGIVLIYKGGQSYDLAVEYWSSEAEYEAKYSSQMTNVTVKKAGEYYITLLNTNYDPEVDQIIQTFKAL